MDEREELMKALRIGPDDLNANRAGTLGERQKQELRRSGMRNVAAALFAGAVLAAILWGVVNKPVKPVQYIMFGILFLAVLAVGIFDYRKTHAAAAEGRVDAFAGPIQVSSRGKNGWWLTVGDRSWRLPTQPWKLRNGASYRVYVAPGANRIVGIEPDA